MVGLWNMLIDPGGWDLSGIDSLLIQLLSLKWLTLINLLLLYLHVLRAGNIEILDTFEAASIEQVLIVVKDVAATWWNLIRGTLCGEPNSCCSWHKEIGVAIHRISNSKIDSRLLSWSRCWRMEVTMIIGDKLIGEWGLRALIMRTMALIWLHLMVFSHIWVSLYPWIIFCIIVFSEAWIVLSDLNWAVKETDQIMLVSFCHWNLEINIRCGLAHQFTKLDSLWLLVTVCETEKLSESIFASCYLLCLLFLTISHLPIFGWIKEYLVWLFRWVTSDGIPNFAYSFILRSNVSIYLLLPSGAHLRLFICLPLLILPHCGHVVMHQTRRLITSHIWFRKMLLAVENTSCTLGVPDSHGSTQGLGDVTAWELVSDHQRGIGRVQDGFNKLGLFLG